MVYVKEEKKAEDHSQDIVERRHDGEISGAS